MNPEEAMIAEFAVYGIECPKERMEHFIKSYGRKPGKFTDRKQW